MKADDLKIFERYYSAELDAYVVFAKNNKADAKGKPSLKRFIVGWQGRHKPEKILVSKKFLDYESAEEHYQMLVEEIDDPDFEYDEVFQDAQKKQVYSWEDNAVIPLLNGKKINKTEAESLVRKVSRDYGIKAPKINWKKYADSSEYDSELNEIDFGHRDEISLLHELAHAIHGKHSETDHDVHHGPAFVWLAIELYNRYAGINLSYLVTSAQHQGILGDLDTDQDITPRSYAKPMRPRKPRGPA